MTSEEKTTTTILTDYGEAIENSALSNKQGFLLQLAGPSLGKRFPLGDKTSVGRDGNADVSIRDKSVSRMHAEIRYNESQLDVSDLTSTNGTFINDDRVESATLQSGDIIRFGRIPFKLLQGEDIESVFHTEIYRLTTTDPMTGLYNRRYFIDSIERELSRSGRYERPLCLLIIDLDHFKKINDSFGHLAGDHILKTTANTLARSLRQSDLLCRYGGEEFCAILPETTLERAIEVAERLRRTVALYTQSFDNDPINVTISIGVSCSNSSDDTLGVSLLKRADMCLLQAKAAGRNSVVSE